MKKLKKMNLKNGKVLSKAEMMDVQGGWIDYQNGCSMNASQCDTSRPCMNENGSLGRCISDYSSWMHFVPDPFAVPPVMEVVYAYSCVCYA